MKHAKIFGLAMVVLFAIGAIGSAAAFAGPEWLLNGAAITSPVSIKSKSVGSLLLSDLKAPSGGTAVKCTGTDEGTVGPGALDLVTEVTATGCTFEKAGSCTTSDRVTAKAVDLPWMTQLELVSGELRDMVTGTGGEPGWAVECTVGGIFEITDTCTGLTSTAISNVSGGVDAIFDAKTPLAKCSVGGANSGMVSGTDLNENPAGGTLTTDP